MVNKHDREIIQVLACKVAEIAALPIQEEKTSIVAQTKRAETATADGDDRPGLLERDEC